jgi:hypothetical protein
VADDQLSYPVLLFLVSLGARAHVVRLSGKLYEALKALVEHRPRLDLYHSALQIRLPDDRFVIECAAILNLRGEERGVVAGGSVGMSWLGRFRHFRYEIRRWRGGSISDLAHAVSGPVRVATDIVRAQRVLDLAPSVPTPVWGRDELRTGEMWNSNSLISWFWHAPALTPMGWSLPSAAELPVGTPVWWWRDARCNTEHLEERSWDAPPTTHTLPQLMGHSVSDAGVAASRSSIGPTPP